MMLSKKLWLALGFSGWAGMYVMNRYKNRKQIRHAEKKLNKVQMHTWEGEGGNLPPAAGASLAKPGAVTTGQSTPP